MKGQFTHCPKANCKFNFVYNWAFGAGQLYNGARRDLHSTFGVKPPLSSGFKWTQYGSLTGHASTSFTMEGGTFASEKTYKCLPATSLAQIQPYSREHGYCLYGRGLYPVPTYPAVMLGKRGDAQRTSEKRYHHLCTWPRTSSYCSIC